MLNLLMGKLLLLILVLVLAIDVKAQYSTSPTPDSVILKRSINHKSTSSEIPAFDGAMQDNGKLVVGMNNNGNFTTFEFPQNSNLRYLYPIHYLIGGVIGTDTLVSVSTAHIRNNEFNPDAGATSWLKHRSLLKSSQYFHKDAQSEHDILCVFYDTLTDTYFSGEDEYDNRPHKPLNVRVDLSGYSWGSDFGEDIVLFDYKVTNIGNMPIKEMYIGYFMYVRAQQPPDFDYDSYSGFIKTFDYSDGFCTEKDTVNMVWLADNDGDPGDSWEWDHLSYTSAIGVQLLRPTINEKIINYNWYMGYNIPRYDWGPRSIPSNDDPWRDMFGFVGAPRGDKNRYYMLSHSEVDYDKMFTVLDHTGEGFMPRPGPEFAVWLAEGMVTGCLYSFGPYDLLPGDSMQYTLAVFAGENFHVNATDYRRYFDPLSPHKYYDKLDFSDLALNSRRARMIYDNPGFDTNGDGYRGEFCWDFIWRGAPDGNPSDSVLVDSVRKYYSGDGVPDFRAMMPPPPPNLRVIPEYGRMTLRWNGQESETTPDVFSGNIDFEGYRVYYAEDNRQASYTLLASYDIDDYLVYEFDPYNRFWNRITQSAKLDSLQEIYGLDFDPSNYYDEFNSFHDRKTDRIFYFVSQDWNQSELNNPLKIHKVYPDASPDDPTDLTAEGWMRYYEYEYSIDNLTPSKPFYFGVTAFDYGASAYDIGALETSPTTNAIREYATLPADSVEHLGLKVTVYPNPYRIDGGYARDGYENRDRTRSAVWARKIHFANLPNICTIRIYTLTGDLVQEIKHFNPDGGPESQHESWNVISRNTQAVVTGIYFWSVRSEMGDQIGKLVIIK